MGKHGRRRPAPHSASENVSPPEKASKTERLAGTVSGESMRHSESGPLRGREERVVSQAGDGDAPSARLGSEAPVKHEEAPKIHLTQEVRFAVVMYGGVSLAVYINGVVQELFKMVRATASVDSGKHDAPPLLSNDELSGTEGVYRRLGQMLGREEQVEPWRPEAPIRTRFVIDILSGTSAGGINAIYLAKALANGQDIDQLSSLWVDEGDIGRLINDEESVRGLGLSVQRPPRSLLNGQRMYRKLLDAFDGMEEKKKSTAEARSPYADELDLFVTSTDFYGLPVPLRLADNIVEEHRHRNVYQLRYNGRFGDKPHNDFLAQHNPFLAFAARSTSAFPFAFDPIKLGDIDAVLERTPNYRHLRGLGHDRERWQEFFPAYRRPEEDYDFADRAFVDGGYLDNKPFGHATEALASRRSDQPVDRKLIYIDPAPEHIEDRAQDVPNAIKNAVGAFTLARYETIREDLQRILVRNRLIDRAGRIASRMEEDVRNGGLLKKKPVRDPDFGKRDLRQMIEVEGVAYGGYHRLKVAAVDDEITDMIAHISGFDAESDEFLAIRYLVRAWRERNFVAYSDEDGWATENEFLVRYDLSYRLRRLRFVLGKIEQEEVLYYRNREETDKISKQHGVAGPVTEEEGTEAFRDELAKLRARLSEVLLDLYRTREELRSPGPESPLVASVEATKLDQGELIELLEEPTEELRKRKAGCLVHDPEKGEAFHDLASVLADRIAEGTNRAAATCEEILDTRRLGEGSQRFVARDIVRDYYYSYDRYDLISFPVLYATEVGEETDPVEVVRISPEDATSLIDERHSERRKLAGAALGHFGAFLDRGWRRNDILWGRLDGAERIVTTLMSGLEIEHERKEQLREELIEEAQLAILTEEFKVPDRDQLLQLLVDAMTKNGSTDQNETNLRELAERELGSPVNPKLQAVLRRSLTGEALLDFFHRSYTVNRKPNQQIVVRTLARSTQVVGKLFEGIARGGAGSRPAAWLARLGRVFSGFAEISVRQSLPNRIFNNWLVLIYAFELFLIVAGLLLSTQVYQAGLTVLVVTAVVHVGVLGLGDYLRGAKRWYLGVPIFVLGIVILLLAGLGVYHLVYYTPAVVREVLRGAFSTLLG